jgi:nicotinic acid mononucleotide adenylyltransferase
MNHTTRLKPVKHPLNDPRYASLWRKSRDLPQKAGFISEEGQKLRRAKPMAVLQRFQAVILMTGCFAPFHEGHLSTAFEFRKKWAARLGIPRTKIACLFSFCHDAYVSTKTKDWPLEKRLVAFHKLREKNCFPFLYEAHAAGPLNFTTVLSAVQKPHPNLPIAFIFGADNANFLHTFKTQEWTGCAARTSSAPKPKTLKPRHFSFSTRHRLQSSTAIRNQLSIFA